jgi:hypothetical protein
MIAELQAGYAGAKAAIDIAKGINSLTSETERNQAVIDIQRNVLDMQQALMAANEMLSVKDAKIREMETKLQGVDRWAEFAAGYVLRDTGQGAFAYQPTPDTLALTGEPEHWLCPACFENRRKSILSKVMLSAGRVELLACHPCKNELVTFGHRPDPMRMRG